MTESERREARSNGVMRMTGVMVQKGTRGEREVFSGQYVVRQIPQNKSCLQRPFRDFLGQMFGISQRACLSPAAISSGAVLPIAGWMPHMRRAIPLAEFSHFNRLPA